MLIRLRMVSCNINMSDKLLQESVFKAGAPEFGVFVIRHFECGSLNITFRERSVVCISACREDGFWISSKLSDDSKAINSLLH